MHYGADQPLDFAGYRVIAQPAGGRKISEPGLSRATRRAPNRKATSYGAIRDGGLLQPRAECVRSA